MWISWWYLVVMLETTAMLSAPNYICISRSHVKDKHKELRHHIKDYFPQTYFVWNIKHCVFSFFHFTMFSSLCVLTFWSSVLTESLFRRALFCLHESDLSLFCAAFRSCVFALHCNESPISAQMLAFLRVFCMTEGKKHTNAPWSTSCWTAPIP